MRNLILMLAVLIGSVAAHAETLNSVDITDTVAYFAKYVHVLKQPIYIYTWAESSDPKMQTVSDSHAPFVLGLAQKSAVSFWNHFGLDDGGNMYGYGLYAAVDPQATMSFGGFGFGDIPNDWTLYQMQAPVGFRFVDLVSDHMIPPQNVRDTLVQFGCTTYDDQGFDPFQPGTAGMSTCAPLIKKIFKDDLQIDGFLYGYKGTDYAACANTPLSADREGAFVITSGRWLTAQNVELFTAATRNVFRERVVLETLINTDASISDGDSDADQAGFRWADMQHEPLLNTAALSKWISANLLGCSAKIPYTDNTPH